MDIITELKSWVVVVVFLLVITLAANAKTIYVDVDAPGPTHDGSNWNNAYLYLQDALDDADVSAKPVEIRVAQGTYTPDQGASVTPGDREASFYMITGVDIYGGYAGYGEADPNAKDVSLYKTILSGDLSGNNVSVSNPCDLLNHLDMERPLSNVFLYFYSISGWANFLPMRILNKTLYLFFA